MKSETLKGVQLTCRTALACTDIRSFGCQKNETRSKNKEKKKKTIAT